LNVNFKELNKDLVMDSDYHKWINNPKINRFLEARLINHDKKSLVKYIDTINKDENKILFGIFVNNIHIGNIKLEINHIHKFADVSIVIGDERLHKSGIGLQAIEFIKNNAKNHFNLRKLIASSYSSNIGSIRLFLKCNFKQIGKFKNHYYDEDILVDKIFFEYFL